MVVAGFGNLRQTSRMNWIHWALLSAFFAALTAVLGKIGVEGINSNLATAIRTSVILVFTWGIAFVTARPIAFRAIGSRSFTFLILSAMATGLSWLCYYRALQIGPASRVAPVDKLSVVFTIALAAAFLHERLTWQQWTGAVLIVSGAITIAWQ
jgi:transporter family protein